MGFVLDKKLLSMIIAYAFPETSPEIQSSMVGGLANKPHPLPHLLKCICYKLYLDLQNYIMNK